MHWLMSLLLVAVLFYLGTRDSTPVPRKPARPSKTREQTDRERAEQEFIRAEEIRRIRSAKIAAFKKAEASAAVAVTELQPLVVRTVEAAGDCASYSTSATARQHLIDPKALLGFLLREHYLEKQLGRHHLTARGLAIGGSYHECADGTWPVWREGSLDAIIQNAAWPVGVVGTFLEHKNKAIQRMLERPQDKNRMHEEGERGTAILELQEQLDFYLTTYGPMHERKLALALDALHRSEDLGRMTSGRPIQIVDYACGQGVASMLFIEFLRKKNADCCIDKAIFIEPSRLSLQACAKRFSGNTVRVAKKFDDLVETDIATTPSCIKFHFFSNILDMADTFFDPAILARKICDSQKGVNYFVCVSPREKAKLDSFMRCFDKHVLISSHQGEIPNPSKGVENKPWQVVWTIFRVELA